MNITNITAPQKYYHKYNNFILFLAGGITNCKNWQNLMIDKLSLNAKQYQTYYDMNVIIANPRQENFPINNKNEAYNQIEWEFNILQRMDYFFIYFDGPSDSDQPICFYELGRNLYRMQEKYRNDWEKRCCICVNKEFKRFNDVIIQTNLACNGASFINVIDNKDIEQQFNNIAKNIIMQIGEFYL